MVTCFSAGERVKVDESSEFHYNNECATLTTDICSDDSGWHDLTFDSGDSDDYRYGDLTECISGKSCYYTFIYFKLTDLRSIYIYIYIGIFSS